MSRTGKCSNYSGCLLAYRNEIIAVPDDGAFVCPECRQPLIECRAAGDGKPRAIPMIILGGISLLVIMGSGAVYFQARHLRDQLAPGQIGSSFEQAEVATEHGELMPSRHMASIAATPAPGGFDVQAGPSNFDLRDPMNRRVRDDVLGHLVVMASEDKARLYGSVGNARQMGRILTIPFPAGHVAVSPAQVDELRAALATESLQPFAKDPRCVFMILGFAELKGDDSAAMSLSTKRAESVFGTLRDGCGVPNVMCAVGMGDSTLYGDQRDAGRDQDVEVWAVLP